MREKAGEMFWPHQSPPSPDYPPLTSNSNCEVVVIGAGISGALAAFYLTRAGVSVILVDRNSPAHASTAACTGLLQYEIDIPLIPLTQLIGRDAATQAYRLCHQSLDTFRQLNASLRHRLEVQSKKSLYLAHLPSELPDFEAEAAARQSCGIPVRALTAAALSEQFRIQRPAALLSDDALDIDPVLFTRQLLREAASQGLTIHTHTSIAHYDADSAGVTLRTSTDLEIRANKIIFATGYETPHFISLPVTLNTTFAFISHPLPQIPPLLPSLLFWESARPYLYIRTTTDNRILVGGADVPGIHTAPGHPLLELSTQTLLQKFQQLFPHIPISVDAAWSGAFAETPDGLPYIGTSPLFPHGLFSLGYGGNGITFSLIAAQLLTDAYKQIPNPHAHLFRLNR